MQPESLLKSSSIQKRKTTRTEVVVVVVVVVHRAGYLTLFDSTQDVTAVYKEFRKFDHLLSKLARCSLKGGELQQSPLIIF